MMGEPTWSDLCDRLDALPVGSVIKGAGIGGAMVAIKVPSGKWVVGGVEAELESAHMVVNAPYEILSSLDGGE